MSASQRVGSTYSLPFRVSSLPLSRARAKREAQALFGHGQAEGRVRAGSRTMPSRHRLRIRSFAKGTTLRCNTFQPSDDDDDDGVPIQHIPTLLCRLVGIASLSSDVLIPHRSLSCEDERRRSRRPG